MERQRLQEAIQNIRESVQSRVSLGLREEEEGLVEGEGAEGSPELWRGVEMRLVNLSDRIEEAILALQSEFTWFDQFLYRGQDYLRVSWWFFLLMAVARGEISCVKATCFVW